MAELGIARDGPALAARLSDPDPPVRARAAFALASVQDPAAVPALLRALGDSDPRVRADAAFAVGQTPDSASSGAVGEALLAALAGESDAVVRGRLYEALGKAGDRASLERLAALRAAGEEADLAMAIARYGLRGVFAPAAVVRLAELLAHPDPAVREAAAYPLGRWRDPGGASDGGSWAEAAGPAVRAALDQAYVFQYGGPGVTAPAGPAPEIPLVAAVGKLDEPADTPRLLHWLEDAVDWRVRVSAARALAPRALAHHAERDSVARALFRALADSSPHVGATAAAALAGADSLSEDLVHDVAVWTTMYRARWQVAGEVLPALARAKTESFVILWLMWLDASDDRNPYARARAMRALGAGNATAGFRVLEDLATWDDTTVAAAALSGLADRWRRGVVDATATVERYREAFMRAVERGDVATVSEAAPVLADSAFVRMGSLAVLERALHAMEMPRDREAMMAIAGALAEIPGPDAGALAAETRVRLAEIGPEAPAARTVDWDLLARLGSRPRLVLETVRGTITVELDAEQAPLTVQTVAEFANAGRYDSVPFHRVVPNFVVQGGDFARGDGYGGPGFEIVSELTRIPYARGTIGMASAGKDTEGSQYFLTHSPQPHLDGRYTAFGRVVEGWEALDALVESDLVLRARVE